MASVGSHIKRLRTEKRMTQENLAEQLHVTRQAVSAWETGKALPEQMTLTLEGFLRLTTRFVR